MFEAITKLFGGKDGHEDDDPLLDPKLCAAALLVHLSAVDGDVSDEERKTIERTLTEHYKLSHFGKTLFLISQCLLILGSVLLGLWLYPLGKVDRSLGATLPIALLVYATPRLLGMGASAQLVTALMLCATLGWLAIYKIQRY